MLASFLKDVGISVEQFMTACKDGSGSPQFNGMNRVGGELQYLFLEDFFQYIVIVEFEPQYTLTMIWIENRKDLNSTQ